MAERRREELNGYIWHLIHATPEVAEVGTRAGGLQGGGDSTRECLGTAQHCCHR